MSTSTLNGIEPNQGADAAARVVTGKICLCNFEAGTATCLRQRNQSRKKDNAWMARHGEIGVVEVECVGNDSIRLGSKKGTGACRRTDDRCDRRGTLRMRRRSEYA